MKKPLLALLLAFILFGCNKPKDVEKPQQEEKKYDVTFSVSGFTQSVVKFASLSPKAKQALGDITKVAATTDKLTDYVDNLYYLITNSSGTVINAVEQRNNPVTGNPATFGTISDKLPAGTYTAYIIGLKGADARNAFGIPEVGRTFPIGSSLINRLSGYNDTFAKSATITVGTADLTQSIQLERIVGGLEVQLESPIPSNITKITVTFQRDLPWIFIDSKVTPSTDRTIETTGGILVTAADQGVSGKKILSYVSNTYASSSVIIRAYAGSSLLIEKTVDNVRCYRNQKTVLTGDLFAPKTSTVGFNTSIDAAWATSTATPIKF